MASKFTRRADETGWLRILLSGTNKEGYLCEYTRVEPVRESGGRSFFQVADGNSDFVGKEASLRQENAAKYLVDQGPGGAATVYVRYVGEPTDEVSPFQGKRRQQWANASFNGVTARITLNSIWDEYYTPIPRGTHTIAAPDHSHADVSTAGYRAATQGLRCTDTWFPIILAGSTGFSTRYIHAGHLSEGCVTFYELTKWNQIYDYLIARRVPNSKGKSIGSLIVQK